jgi:hypothetical protein
MANQAANFSGQSRVLTGSLNNGNPNHYRTVKTYTKTAGGNIITAGLIVAAVCTVVVTFLDWVIPPVERPRTGKPMRKR